MAKGRGLLQNAVKAVKQQKKTDKTKKTEKTVPGSKSAPASKKSQSGTIWAWVWTSSSEEAEQNQKPTIPFSPSDSILLIGEGDLSFAASLITHHRCTNVTATVLEKDLAELSAKYPHVPANISVIEDPSQPNNRLLYGIDARKLPAFTTKPPSKPKPNPNPNPNLHTCTTTTATPTPTGTIKRIIFNFPHTGGKSTDVNRQVRHNQELLVDFFRRAQPSLAPGGTIVVTLFEGEPYTLWNVRDLARHAGLQVERSFRFVASVYPGYEHARTLGVVRNRRGGVAVGAWRGEERAARSFVFVRKGEGEGDGLGGGGKGKRKREEESSDEEEESEEEGGGGDGDWGDGSEEMEGEDEEEKDDDDDDDDDEEEEGDNRSESGPENEPGDANPSRNGD